jgi:hypothetical protein
MTIVQYLTLTLTLTNTWYHCIYCSCYIVEPLAVELGSTLIYQQTKVLLQPGESVTESKFIVLYSCAVTSINYL